MKRFPFIFLLLLGLASLLGNCTTTEQLRAKHGYQSDTDKMNACVGLTKNQLTMRWGVPDKVAPDGGSGEILIYASNTFGYTWKYRLFYLDEQGKVYHWLTQTQSIPPQQFDVNVYVH